MSDLIQPGIAGASVVVLAGSTGTEADVLARMLERQPGFASGENTHSLAGAPQLGGRLRLLRLAEPSSIPEANLLAESTFAGCPGARVLAVIRDARDAIAGEALGLLSGNPVPKHLPETARAALRHAHAYHTLGVGPPSPILPLDLLRPLLAGWIRNVALIQALARVYGPAFLLVKAESLGADAPRVLAGCLGFLAASDDPPRAARLPDRTDMVSVPVGAELSWQSVLTNDAKSATRASVGSLLVELGYERDLDW